MIGCGCAVCESSDSRDKRLRPSIVLEVKDGPTILVDTTPDLRQQALRHGLTRVDAVLFTHPHADHVLGLDELRRFNALQESAITCYADAATWAGIRRTFSYVFDDAPRLGGGIPRIDSRDVDGPFSAAGIRAVPVPLLHGRMPVLGFRFGTFAYLTDCNALPDAAWALLDGVETLVIDALRDKPHPTHFTVAQALDAVRQIGPRRTYLTHMTHDLGYEATAARLPVGVAPAYDGLVFDVTVEGA